MIEIAEFNEIVPNIYLGSYDGIFTKDFKNLNITHIISITPEEETPYANISNLKSNPNIIKYRFPITSKLSVDNCIQIIKTVGELLNELKKNDSNRIYIHCYEGVSRSAACVYYYVDKYIRDINNNINNVMEYMLSKRPNVNLNEKMKECISIISNISNED